MHFWYYKSHWHTHTHQKTKYIFYSKHPELYQKVNGGNWVFHGNASISGWEEMDGNLGPYVRDADGSVTGLANASLVRNLPIYTGPECIYHDNWGMSVCPYRYIKVNLHSDVGEFWACPYRYIKVNVHSGVSVFWSCAPIARLR